MKKTIEIDATQWNKHGDHPDVNSKVSVLTRSGYGYIKNLNPMSTAWVELEPQKEKPEDKGQGIAEFTDPKTGDVYYRSVLHFSMYKLKGEKITKEIEEDDPFYKDCLDIEGHFHSRKELSVYGYLNPPATDGRVAVFPGDWIVVHGDTRLVMDDKKYKELYGND